MPVSIPKTPIKISSTQLQRKLGEVVHRCSVNKEHFMVENHGYEVMAIIPIEVYQSLMKYAHTVGKNQS